MHYCTKCLDITSTVRSIWQCQKLIRKWKLVQYEFMSLFLQCAVSLVWLQVKKKIGTMYIKISFLQNWTKLVPIVNVIHHFCSKSSNVHTGAYVLGIVYEAWRYGIISIQTLVISGPLIRLRLTTVVLFTIKPQTQRLTDSGSVNYKTLDSSCNGINSHIEKTT